MQRRKGLSVLPGVGRWALWGAARPSLWVVGTRAHRRLSLPVSSTVTTNLKGSPQTAFPPWALESLWRPGRNEFIGWQEVPLQGRPVARVWQGKNEEGMTVGGGRVLPCHIGALNPMWWRTVAAQAVTVIQRTKTFEPVTLVLLDTALGGIAWCSLTLSVAWPASAQSLGLAAFLSWVPPAAVSHRNSPWLHCRPGKLFQVHGMWALPSLLFSFFFFLPS